MPVRYYNRLAFVGLFYSVLCLLSVFSYRFPGLLTTPHLRNIYDAEWLRVLLFSVNTLALGLAVISLIFSQKRRISILTLAILGLAGLLGGAEVPVDLPVVQKPFYLSLDLIILDLFFMSAVFVPLERLFFRKHQRFLRHGLETDMAHYGLNHLLMGLLFALINFPGNWLNELLNLIRVKELVQSLPILLQVGCVWFLTDFVQYFVHRIFHKNSRFWQYHKIHHSCTTMDWLASSRLHIVDVVITRSISYVPVVLLGFSPEALKIYIPLVALQALFVHSNVRWTFGPLRYIFTTPLVHHWHHSNEPQAMDKNFAVSFSIIDVAFGSFYCPKRWPKGYGLISESISPSFWKQLIYPFITALKRR